MSVHVTPAAAKLEIDGIDLQRLDVIAAHYGLSRAQSLSMLLKLASDGCKK